MNNISSNNSKYCPRCGTKNKIQANFCHKCGYEFKDTQKEYSVKPTINSDSSNQLNSIDKRADKSLKHIAMLVISVIALVVACLVIGIHSSSDYSEDNSNSSSSTSNVDSTHQEAEHEAEVINNNSGNLDSILMNEYQDNHVVGDHIDIDVDTTSNQDSRVQDMWNEMYDDKSDADSIPVNIEAEGVVVATGTTDSGELSFND